MQGLRSHISQKTHCHNAFYGSIQANANTCIPTLDFDLRDTTQSEELNAFLDRDPFAAPDFDPPIIAISSDTGSFALNSSMSPGRHAEEDEVLHSDRCTQVEDVEDEDEVSHSDKRTRVEDVEDEEWGGLPKRPWVESFQGAGSVLKEGITAFEKLRRKKEKKQRSLWAPFESQDEWQLAQWLLTSGLTQKAIDSFLKLHIVRVIACWTACRKNKANLTCRLKTGCASHSITNTRSSRRLTTCLSPQSGNVSAWRLWG